MPIQAALLFFFFFGPADSPHSRYCNIIYMAAERDNEIKHSTPLDLAIDAIEHFRSSQLSDAPAQSLPNSTPLSTMS